jgi:hypothetical protein
MAVNPLVGGSNPSRGGSVPDRWVTVYTAGTMCYLCVGKLRARELSVARICIPTIIRTADIDKPGSTAPSNPSRGAIDLDRRLAAMTDPSTAVATRTVLAPVLGPSCKARYA